MDALTYNQAQKINADTIAKIQRTVGAAPDGVFGPKTIAKIAAWQAQHGLTADGKVGATTLAAFQKAWEHDDDTDTSDGADEVSDDAEIDPDDASIVDLQNDLFAFGFEPGAPDGHPGSRTRHAIASFQAAARSPLRVFSDRRQVITPTYRGNAASSPGELDTQTLAELALWKMLGYRWVAVGAEYIERRVRVANYGRMPRSSTLLVDVPGTQGKPRRLHRLAADALTRMLAAAKAEAGLELLVQSGWRAHRWKDWADYEKTVIAKYGSLKRGRTYLGYDSPHETGLAVDFGTEGLYPVSSTAAKQRREPSHAWLVANAWRFGWHPYKAEPWHWEFPLSLRAWQTGESDWA